MIRKGMLKIFCLCLCKMINDVVLLVDFYFSFVWFMGIIVFY